MESVDDLFFPTEMTQCLVLAYNQMYLVMRILKTAQFLEMQRIVSREAFFVKLLD